MWSTRYSRLTMDSRLMRIQLVRPGYPTMLGRISAARDGANWYLEGLLVDCVLPNKERINKYNLLIRAMNEVSYVY